MLNTVSFDPWQHMAVSFPVHVSLVNAKEKRPLLGIPVVGPIGDAFSYLLLGYKFSAKKIWKCDVDL